MKVNKSNREDPVMRFIGLPDMSRRVLSPLPILMMLAAPALAQSDGSWKQMTPMPAVRGEVAAAAVW
jgi:hypothetical protein